MKKEGNFRNAILLLTLVQLCTMGYSQANDTLLLPVKVHHIEPLYIDLVRDLGARKGEKEINLAADFTNTRNYSEYAVLAEYEFAPFNRLGLEVETDFIFYKSNGSGQAIPGNKLDNVRLSTQYSFYVSEKYRTTLAIGYTQVFAFTEFDNYNNNQLIMGMVYSPFFIAAKRLGENFYTIILTGPLFEHEFHKNFTTVNWQINPSIQYGVPNSSHFVGIEFNQAFINSKFEMIMRPQGKIQLTEDLALGIVAGFPLTKSDNKFSSFFRIIYEL